MATTVMTRHRYGEIKISNLAEIAQRHEDGEHLGVLAQEIGIIYNTLSMKLKAAGYFVRSRYNEKTITDEEVIRLYQDGYSISGVGQICFLSANAIRNRLLRNGITLRNGAKTRENLLTFATPIESDLLGELQELGVSCTPQKADLGYNIDLALDRFPIAIEIENGSAASSRNRPRLLKRTSTLLKRGWCVFFVVSWRRIPDWTDVIEVLMPLIGRAECGDNIFGQYGVVNCRGQVLRTPRWILPDMVRLENL